MRVRLQLLFSLCILISGCDTSSTYTNGQSTFEQKLTQIDLEMPLDDFLKVFPNAKLEVHDFVIYERKDYLVYYNWGFSAYRFAFADGYLNSYKKLNFIL